MKIPLISGFQQNRSEFFDYQKMINIYPEFTESGNSESNVVFHGTPGLNLFSTLTGDGNRGLHKTAGERVFTVIGNTLYEIFSSGTYASRGTLATSKNNVGMGDNRDELLIVDGFTGYILTLSTNVFTTISRTGSAAGFPSAPTHVGFLDQYLIVNDSGTQNFYISGINDATSWAALDSSTAESSPDYIEALIVSNQNIWFFGKQSTEVFYNNGNSTFTFARIPGAIMPIGIEARYSLSELDGRLYWLGNNKNGGKIIYRSNQYQAEPISTHSIETQIAKMSNPGDAIGWSYQQEGHYFYLISFLDDNRTFCYDASNNKWHERAYLSNGVFEKHRAINQVYAFGKNLVGDHSKPLIYELDLDYYSDNGDPLKRLITSPVISQNRKNISHISLEIVMETGVGLTGTDEPNISLRYSDDGAKSWSNEITKGIGEIGQYNKRVKFHKLGSSRHRNYEVSISDPVKVAIVDMELEASVNPYG